MWINFKIKKPTQTDLYFVIEKGWLKEKNYKPIILEYNKELDEFGYSFTYGQWEGFSYDKEAILYWMEIKYPEPPSIIKNI